MKGIIYCKDRNSVKYKGSLILKEIIKKYELLDIKGSYVFSSNRITAEFSNGDKWTVIPASENNRGARCNIAYIERNIDYNVYTTVISPSVHDFPYSAIHLWGEGELHIDDKPDLPFR